LVSIEAYSFFFFFFFFFENLFLHIYINSCFRALCDVQQTGKLNLEQFALAMWLVEQTVKGVKPPAVLAPDMIPPCMRPKPADPALLVSAFLNSYAFTLEHANWQLLPSQV
jgi:hypothetical protein